METELAKQAPSLLALVMITTPLSLLAWRMYSRTMSHLDKWFDRHETAELKQFETIDRLACSIDKLTSHLDSEAHNMTVKSAAPGEIWYGIPEPPELQQPVWEVDARYLRQMQADTRDWGHIPLGLAELHADADCQGEGVTVAILDTGVDFSHPDLAPSQAASGHKDYTGSRVGFSDLQGHGSHVAGIVASAQNGSGVVGAAPRAKIVSLKILGDNGRGLSSWTDAALEEAGRQGCDIVSGSLGGPKRSTDTPTRRIVRKLLDMPHHPWIVFALGNEGPAQNSVGDPGWYPEILGVAASNRLNRITDFSSRDPDASHVVACPGEEIVSTLPGNRYGAMSGTSMATPYASGCLAGVRSKIKKLGLPMPHMSVVLEGIRATSADVPPVGPDTASGNGILRPKKLLEWLLVRLKPNPSPTPPPVKPPETIVVSDPRLLERGVEITIRLLK